MSEAVNRSYEIIFGCGVRIFVNKIEQGAVVRIGKKDRLDVGIVDTDVFHSVFFLICASQFVFFYDACLIVAGICTDNNAILRLWLIVVCRQACCLRVNVILFFVVLHKPSFFLKFLELPGCFFVDARVVFACFRAEVDFRLDNVIKWHFVITCLDACFLWTEDVIGTTLYFFYELFGRTDECFDDGHVLCRIEWLICSVEIL